MKCLLTVETGNGVTLYQIQDSLKTRLAKMVYLNYQRKEFEFDAKNEIEAKKLIIKAEKWVSANFINCSVVGSFINEAN